MRRLLCVNIYLRQDTRGSLAIGNGGVPCGRTGKGGARRPACKFDGCGAGSLADPACVPGWRFDRNGDPHLRGHRRWHISPGRRGNRQGRSTVWSDIGRRTPTCDSCSGAVFALYPPASPGGPWIKKILYSPRRVALRPAGDRRGRGTLQDHNIGRSRSRSRIFLWHGVHADSARICGGRVDRCHIAQLHRSSRRWRQNGFAWNMAYFLSASERTLSGSRSQQPPNSGTANERKLTGEFAFGERPRQAIACFAHCPCSSMPAPPGEKSRSISSSQRARSQSTIHAAGAVCSSARSSTMAYRIRVSPLKFYRDRSWRRLVSRERVSRR